MDKNREFWTSANRKVIVLGTEVRKLSAGNLSRPPVDEIGPNDRPELVAAITEGKTVWMTLVKTQDGMSEPQRRRSWHVSEEEAKDEAAKYRVGDELEDFHDFMLPQSPDFDADNLSLFTELIAWRCGSPPTGEMMEALEGAGVYGNGIHLSTEVVSWIGDKGIEKLKDRFGENWECIAALEFCLTHFHQTSLATLAARINVSAYIAENDFDSGYASREFLLFYSGAEQRAIKDKKRTKNSGLGGGKTSKKRKHDNLEALLEELEKLAHCVPFMGEESVVTKALENALANHEKMPKTQSTLDGYITTLRSEQPYKARYDAVFRQNA